MEKATNDDDDEGAATPEEAADRRLHARLLKNAVQHHAGDFSKLLIYLRTVLAVAVRPPTEKDVHALADAAVWAAGPGDAQLRAFLTEADIEIDDQRPAIYLASPTAKTISRWLPTFFASVGWSAAQSLGDEESKRKFSASITAAYDAQLAGATDPAAVQARTVLPFLAGGAGSTGDRTMKFLPDIITATAATFVPAHSDEDDDSPAAMAKRRADLKLQVGAILSYILVPFAARDQRWEDVVTLGKPWTTLLGQALAGPVPVDALHNIGDGKSLPPTIDALAQPFAYFLYALDRTHHAPEAIALLDRFMPAIRNVQNGGYQGADNDRLVLRSLLSDDLLQSAVDSYADGGRLQDAYRTALMMQTKAILRLGVPIGFEDASFHASAIEARPVYEQVVSLATAGNAGATWDDVITAVDASKSSSVGATIQLHAVAEASGARATSAYFAYLSALAAQDKAGRPGIAALRSFVHVGDVAGASHLVDSAINVENARSALLSLLPAEAVAALAGAVNLGQLKAALRPGEIVVAPMVVGNRIAIVTFTHETDPAITWSPMSFDQFSNVARQLHRQFSLTVQFVPTPDPALLTSAYNALLAPVQSRANGMGHILWSPDPRLSAIPFAALQSPGLFTLADGTKTPYVGTAYDISFVPRLASLVFERTKGANARGATSLAVGDISMKAPVQPRAHRVATQTLGAPPLDALPLAGPTIEKFVQLTHGVALTQGNATITALRAEPRTSLDLLMFYTHGQGNLADGGAGLYMTPEADAPTGFLRTGDILGLGIRPHLVILASCNSGQASDAGSEPYGGLVQSFLALGAQAVLSAQGKVDSDATTKLVTSMTATLSTGSVGPAEALRLAQRELASDPRYGNPVFWAQFVWVGDGATR